MKISELIKIILPTSQKQIEMESMDADSVKQIKVKYKLDFLSLILYGIFAVILLTVGVSVFRFLWDSSYFMIDEETINNAVLYRYIWRTFLSATVTVGCLIMILLVQINGWKQELKTCVYIGLTLLTIGCLLQIHEFNNTYHSDKKQFDFNNRQAERHGYLMNGTKTFEITEDDAYMAKDIDVQFLDNVELNFAKNVDVPLTCTIWYKYDVNDEYTDENSYTTDISLGVGRQVIEMRKKDIKGLKIALNGNVGDVFYVSSIFVNCDYQNRMQEVLSRIIHWGVVFVLVVLLVLMVPLRGRKIDWFNKSKHMKIATYGFLPVTLLLLLVAFLVRSMVNWVQLSLGKIEFSVIVLQLRSPLNGTDKGIFTSIIKSGVIPAFIVVVLGFVLFLILRRCMKILGTLPNGRTPGWLKFVTMLMSFVFLINSLVVKGEEVGMWEYVANLNETSDFYEDYYVNPADVKLTFPEKKRNLIYIYMESMEATYSSDETGGIMYDSLIPHLTDLAQNHINFSDKEEGQIGGGVCLTNTEYTVGGIVASTAGMHLALFNGGGNTGTFLPGVTNLGDILEAQGYNQVFLCGSEGEFAGRDTYFTSHGNYTIKDYQSAIDDGYIDAGYKVFWGHEDKILYERAQDQLTELASKDEPFNFTMLTVDTHYPDGYKCDLCRKKFESKYENAISCADRQLILFFRWLKEQDFYENTTVVIVGDHTSMVGDGDAVWKTMPDDYERTVYNSIINSPYENGEKGYSMDSVTTTERRFSTMDMFPTTLAALGVKIDGDRLGLGTNLFSQEQTLVEQLGQNYINGELEKRDKMYDTFY